MGFADEPNDRNIGGTHLPDHLFQAVFELALPAGSGLKQLPVRCRFNLIALFYFRIYAGGYEHYSHPLPPLLPPPENRSGEAVECQHLVADVGRARLES